MVVSEDETAMRYAVAGNLYEIDIKCQPDRHMGHDKYMSYGKHMNHGKYMSYDKHMSHGCHVSHGKYVSAYDNHKIIYTSPAKRLMDLSISIIALILLAPLIVLIALLVKLGSRGSVVFKQKRWGHQGKIITIYKFRSMYVDCSCHKGTEQVIENDARITFIGKFLRKSSLDEIPQLFNVLKGDLSLVGPRCHPIGMYAAGMPYEHLVSQYHRRHSVIPGMTGLAQVYGLRGPTTNKTDARKRIKYDFLYIRKQSVFLDLQILIRTGLQELFIGTGS